MPSSRRKPVPGPGQVDLFGARTLPELPSNADLFIDSSRSRHLVLPGAELWYEPSFFEPEEAKNLFDSLNEKKSYDQEYVKIYGKLAPLPRLTAWYGDPGFLYRYSGIRMRPREWTPELHYIRSRVEERAGVRFNSALLNYYQSGKSKVGLHSDDEPELGNNPVIASVSLGCVRKFRMHCKYPEDDQFRDSPKTVHFSLANGSLLIMGGETQRYWKHEVPREARIKETRINLTFRRILS